MAMQNLPPGAAYEGRGVEYRRFTTLQIPASKASFRSWEHFVSLQYQRHPSDSCRL